MRRRHGFTLLAIVLGLVGAYLGSGDALLDPATYRPERLSFVGVTAAFAFLAGLWLLPACRLRLLARFQGHGIGRRSALLAHVAMMLGAAVTPSGSGGAPTLVAALGRMGIPWGAGMGIALQIFILDLLALACLVPLALLHLLDTDGQTPQLAWLTGVVGVAALLGAMALTMRPRPIVRTLLLLGRLRGLRRWRGGLRSLARGYYRSARTFASLGARHWSRLLIVSLLGWLASFGLLWNLLVIYGGDQRYPDVVARMSVVSVLSFVVPTPGASGFMELAATVGTRAPAAPAVTAAVMGWRLGTFYLTYLLGPVAFWLLLDPRRHRDGRATAPGPMGLSPGSPVRDRGADPRPVRRRRP
jgi:uncharacterized protein (TIRG00374 family)